MLIYSPLCYVMGAGRRLPQELGREGDEGAVEGWIAGPARLRVRLLALDDIRCFWSPVAV